MNRCSRSSGAEVEIKESQSLKIIKNSLKDIKLSLKSTLYLCRYVRKKFYKSPTVWLPRLMFALETEEVTGVEKIRA